MSIERKIYAALDLGTHNCRLSIAVRSNNRPSQPYVIGRFSRYVMLGRGMQASGKLSQAAMDRAVVALKMCQEKLVKHDIYKKRYVTTHACRLAANSDVFLDRVYKETGLALEILDKQSEAQLVVYACSPLIKKAGQPAIVFDIGGGSTQISLVNNVQASLGNSDFLADWISLPVGVVNLTEKFCISDDIKQNFLAMQEYVMSNLQSLLQKRPLATINSNYYLLGGSGTATTLASMSLGLERYARDKVDGLWLKKVCIERLIEDIVCGDPDGVLPKTYVARPRLQLLLAGCAILSCLIKIWPAEALLVADRGLRDGILGQLMNGPKA